MRDQVAILGNQRAQYRHQFSGGDVMNLDNLRRNVIRTGRAKGPNWTRKLPGRGIGENLDQISAGDSDVTMYLQY